MININKSVASTCFIICLSLFLTIAISFTGFAQTSHQNESQPGVKVEHKKQNTVQANHEEDKVKKDSEGTLAQNHEKTIVEEEQDLMEKALELLDMADSCWKKGDIENALNYLDKAYALVLDTNGDVEIARQKDDLRLLISKRILALYSTQNTKTNGKASEIQQLLNADVEKEIKSFQTVERDFFIASYQRSGLYRDIIKDELKKAGMPEEIFWLPLVESGFKVSALSSARALGLWQFIPSTGYKFGLTRDEWMDERMDVIKSTRAAIAYLKELHGMFGDWLTVLAAYNCGEGRVLRVISRQRINYFDRFWDLYKQLPNETARYVPRFLATLQIIKDPSKYGFDLKMAEPVLNYETVKVNKMMKLSDIATKIEVSEDLINILNAELRHKTTPDREYEMRIPKDALQIFNMVYTDIPEVEKPRPTYTRSTYLKHRVRSGETVASIAKRYKVSAETIYDNNRINRKKKLARGQVIRIPVTRTEIASPRKKSSSNKSESSQCATAVSVKTYKIKQGDSLLSIAKKYNVSVTKLKEVNHLKNNSIQAGRIIKVPVEQTNSSNDATQEDKEKHVAVKKNSGKTKNDGKALTSDDVAQLGTNKHIVTKGESISSIARKYHVEMAKIKEWNEISGDDTITPGQILVVKK